MVKIATVFIKHLSFVLLEYCINVLSLVMQVPITLLEYSMNAVTEGIDAIASTRVSICSIDRHTIMNGSTGQTIHRTFRYEHEILFASFSFTWKNSKE